MNKSDVAATTEATAAQTGCCGSDGAHDHATPSHAGHDHGSHAASKADATAKPAGKPKSGHGSGCCCS